MSARKFLSWQLALATLGLASCLLCLPVEAAAQRGGHGGFGGGGFRGGAGFGGARMAAPASTFRPSSFGSRPITYVARAPQPYRGIQVRSRPGGVPRSSYYRPLMRPPRVSSGPRGSGPIGGNRFARPGPGSARSGSRASTWVPRPGHGWQHFGGGNHHGFRSSNFWLNPFYNPYFLSPFFWAPYPFYPACTPYDSEYGDDSGPGYTNSTWPAEENEAEAPAEENVTPESEAMTGEESESQLAPEPLEQTVLVELADGRTKTFTWKGDKMTVTESPAPSKATPAAPAPQSPPASLQP
jgi:hypothetical protein